MNNILWGVFFVLLRSRQRFTSACVPPLSHVCRVFNLRVSQCILDTIVGFCVKYPVFSYECVHFVVRLMRLHGSVAHTIAPDASITMKLETILRQ